MDPDRTAPRATVLQGGRRKAYRPLPEGERLAAFDEGLAAYDRGEWFEAHELLEPAWMGTDRLPDRELCQGLIKLAAGHVHRERGNPRGMRKNLVGARSRLTEAIEGDADDRGLDLPALVASIDDRLARLGALGDAPVSSIDAIAVPRRS
jgi:predicted metal-dependent hydrolase